ncbi:hypothetical protein [Gordonia soli]|uniref:Uncharacterized protein n=1 Tax=Gordonia soli NBRC 108243 TaxID=1223545 RepID=M0QQ30_9ACTN|nr:hypothetical protein [Gordonia soli]GAC70795.1 hypothetical protein GS4_41_00420 [Gordonia soli NBRC 108243]
MYEFIVNNLGWCILLAAALVLAIYLIVDLLRIPAPDPEPWEPVLVDRGEIVESTGGQR